MDGRTIYTALVILYFLALFWGKPKQYKLITAIFVAGIAFVAFHAVSIYDLNNYYAGQGGKSELSLGGFWDHYSENDEIGAQLWFWLCSKFHYLGVLPAMTVAVFYGGMLLVLYAVGEKTKVKQEHLALAAIFVICTTKYYSVLAGIRNHMGFMIFAIAFIAEFLLEKDWRLCWLGYLLAMQFHTSIFVLLALRVFLVLYQRYPKRVMMGILLFLSLFGYPIIGWLAQVTNNSYLQSVAGKADSYYGGDGTGNEGLSLGNLSTAWVKLICIMLLVAFAYYLWQKGKLPQNYRGYVDYMVAVFIFTIGASGNVHSLVRFPEFLGLLAAPLLMIVLTSCEKLGLERETRKTCIRRKPARYSVVFFWMFLLDSGMFFAFQFLGTLNLIGWQTPALIVGSIR